MPLFVLAIPELAEADAARIDAIRSEHDPQRDLVAPHVTLVFGTTALPASELAGYTSLVSAAHTEFDVVFRAGVPYPEAAPSEPGTDAYVFLVPDEGNSNLIRLHDELYAGPLASERRFELPYVPHVTLGRAPLPRAASLAAEWNASEPPIHAHIDTLTVVELEDAQLAEHARIPLTPVP